CLQMFLTVFRSNSDQNLTEVPITPETLCRDVVEFCKQPGEGGCYLAEAWRSSERMVGEKERMMEVLQQWGQHRVEVRYRLRQLPAPAGSRAAGLVVSRTPAENTVGVVAGAVSLEAKAPAAQLQVSLSDLRDLAAWQQQRISSQQQLLASKEQQLRCLEVREQQELSEQEHLRLLRENAHNQEAKLRRVRALRGQVEHKRLSNGKLGEEVQQMSQLLQQKQRELLLAASRVEQLSQQLEALRSSRPVAPPPPCRRELERLHREPQLAARLSSWTSDPQLQSGGNQDQSDPEAAAMERRLAQLRQRLRRKKAALLQKDRRPVGSGGGAPQHGAPARVAAVGPYIQSSSQGRPGAAEPPEDSSEDGPPKPPPRPLKAASGESRPGDSGEGRHASVCLRPWLSAGFLASKTSGWCSGHASTLPRTSGLSRHASGLPACPGSGDPAGGPLPAEPSGPDRPPPVPGRTRNLENLQKDPQATAQPLSSSGTAPLSPFSTGTFPGKTRGSGAQRRAPGLAAGYSSTLPLPGKQDKPPAAAVRPYTPEPEPPPTLQRPPTVAASSIYSMYTQQGAPGRSLAPSGQGTLPRRPRVSHVLPVYGKPVLPASGGQPPSHGSSGNAAWWDPDGMEADASKTGEEPGAEHASPRPLSPTKLLPFLSNPHRNTSDVDLEALRRRLHHAPRPLKKRSSITEPEGPAGPNIQKLLYQKTTLAAMETVPMEAVPTHTAGSPAQAGEDGSFRDGQSAAGHEDESLAPPPLPPRSPVPDPAPCRSLLPPPPPPDEFPPYPPPPYPSCGRSEQGGDVVDPPPPEVRGQVPPERKSILRRCGSEPPDRGARVRFNPLALLLDASLEGEYDLVQRVIYDVDDPSAPNDEGITALHNAVCAGHAEIVKFLVQFGVNANAADSDGWTPLHCAASCNNVQLCKFLVESGAAVFAATHSDTQTAADKCEEMEDGYAQCSQFLYGVQEKMGVMNRGVVYALWDYEPQQDDELRFSEGDCLTVLRREDQVEEEWWWARCGDHEGYIPRNLLGLYLRVKPRQRSLA
uniref:Tumor protein p53 binding protein, 2b n=1 Tax=Tetraodon nigroviridis TaxID=99883 RepID=H3CGL8_TETNG